MIKETKRLDPATVAQTLKLFIASLELAVDIPKQYSVSGTIVSGELPCDTLPRLHVGSVKTLAKTGFKVPSAWALVDTTGLVESNRDTPGGQELSLPIVPDQRKTPIVRFADRWPVQQG